MLPVLCQTSCLVYSIERPDIIGSLSGLKFSFFFITIMINSITLLLKVVTSFYLFCHGQRLSGPLAAVKAC